MFRQCAFRRPVLTLALGMALAALAVTGCDGGGSSASSTRPATIPQPPRAQLAAADLARLPLAPESDRVDIAAPVFSHPTQITNPLFPISRLHSAVLTGRVAGKAFHTETTLLPQTRIIEWSRGKTVEARTSQYLAYLDGHIEEAALDYYAQANDGSVWYLGEDVFDYNPDGFIESTEGTWLAGREGPPEMIMPAHPEVGDVHRAENIPSIAFEEVTIKRVGRTVDGPTGRVGGAMVARELHDDGTFSDKVFAPGYGEFYTASGGEVEAMALAAPTDALNGPVPPALNALSAGANRALGAVRSSDWSLAQDSQDAVRRAWQRYAQRQVPPRVAAEMNRALGTLAAATDAQARARAGTAAIDVAQSALDLELRYRAPVQIDVARFALWARQVAVDAAADDSGAVRSDVAAMEWVRDRFAHTLGPADLTSVDAGLLALRESAVDRDLTAARAQATRLQATLARL